jgi:hypothetical protein
MGKQQKIIIPSNLQNLAGMVSAFAELNEKIRNSRERIRRANDI